MIGNSEGISNLPKLSVAKSAIYESMNNLRKWRENQLQNFQKKQISEHQSLLEQTEMKRKSLEQYFENNQDGIFSILKTQLLDGTTDSTIGSENTLQESSVTGHFLRCFSDTSGDSYSSLLQDESHKNYFQTDEKISKNVLDKENKFHEENSDTQNPVSTVNRPKKPFLKKGSGLLRYMPKTRRNQTNFFQSSESQNSLPEPPTKSVLKSSITNQKTLPATHQLNRVQFSEPVAFVHEEETLKFPPKYKFGEFENMKSNVQYGSRCYSSSNLDSEDSNKLSNTSLSSENQELAEFEMLETCAQNSSFNSDSSIVQRVLHGPPFKGIVSTRKSILSNHSKEQLNRENSGMNLELDKSAQINSLEDIEIRKKRLQNLISDINPRITSLQNELLTLNSNPLEEDQEINDRCSTPIEQNSHSRSSPSDDNSSRDTSMDSIIFVSSNQVVGENPEPNNHLEGHQLIDEQKNSESGLNSASELNASPVNKQILRSKMEELENEIKIYQETNAQLSVIRKERDEVLKKLKKEKDEIAKYKEEEKRKLDLELESERKQLKRERETFNRYQKLRRDNPGKKEREEISSLRQEVEKLQEEIKRQKNKFNNDIKRLKNQLASAEKERDTLKLENITLEEQCQDLLTALKSTRKEESRRRKSEDQAKLDLEKEKQCQCSQKIETEEKSTSVDSELLSPEQNFISCDSKTEGVTPKVKFDTSLKYNSSVIDRISFHSEIEASEKSASASTEIKGKTSEKQYNGEIMFEEFKQSDKVERVYISGEKEEVYPSGTVKHTSADGKTVKVKYPNGDIIEIFPDKSEVLRYVTGVVSKHLPSGLKVTEFPDGQIHQWHPDGLEEVIFPNGTTECFFPNGTKEIHDKDGTVTRLYVDGTEITEFANGEKIIRTSTLKRREWPDGSVKIIYNCGRQETRFADGRIKIKDKDGKPVVDTKYYKRLGGK